MPEGSYPSREAAEQAAMAGDTRAMLVLGNYFYEQSQLGESARWFSAAADAGDVTGMQLASRVLVMHAYVGRKVSGNDTAYGSVPDMMRAVAYAQGAQAADCMANALQERGACLFWAVKNGQLDRGQLLNAVNDLIMAKSMYEQQHDEGAYAHMPQTLFHLGLAVDEAADMLPAVQQQVGFEALRQYVMLDNAEERGIGWAILGTYYLQGHGTPMDAGQARECFIQATANDFDCSDTVRQFKWRPLSGWVFMP